MKKPTREKIIDRLKNETVNCEEALEALSDTGLCPNLYNDDSGRWAVKFDGYQTVPDPRKATDIQTTCWIEAKDWKKTIRAALIYALSQ